MKENILRDKSYRFALRIIKLYQHLAKQHEPAKLAESLLADFMDLENSHFTAYDSPVYLIGDAPVLVR